MEENRDTYEEIKKLASRLTPDERYRLIAEILVDSSERTVDKSVEEEMDSLKAMWRKYSRPIGSWYRDDIHDRGM